MTPSEPRDIYPLAEPFEAVSVATGEIHYEPRGYLRLRLSLARDYSALFAIRMDKVWREGRREDFERAALELIRLGYSREADLLLSHFQRGGGLIQTLPKSMSALFQLFRGELHDLAELVARDRPLSTATLRERVAELVDSVDGLEEGCIRALRDDPNYNPSPWSPEDVVILTTFLPESEE